MSSDGGMNKEDVGNLKEKNKAEGITFPDFTQYYKAAIIKTEYLWHKQTHRSLEQNRELKINPHLYS